MYNKETKETFVVDGDLQSNFLQKNETVKKGNNVSNHFIGISIYELERFFGYEKVIKIIDWLLVYMSFPMFLMGLYLNIEEIKRILQCSFEIELYKIFPLVILILSVFVLSLFLHEIGHTIIAISRGAYVPEIGIGIKNKKFIAYTKILQIEKLKSKNDKICVHFGGILSNVFIFSFALIVNGVIINNIFFKVIACVNFFITLFNFSIYFNSDGADILKCIIKSEEDNNSVQPKVKYVVIFSAILLNLILPVVVMISSALL